MENIIDIYTDGACSGNPGPGGWGAVLLFNGNEKEISGFKKETTNNEMELLAVIKALEIIKHPYKIKLFSDSAYVVNAFNQKWIYNWQKNNYKNSKKQEIANKELWIKLIELNNKYNIEWIKVKGHSDNKYNNRCDEMAVAQVKSNT